MDELELTNRAINGDEQAFIELLTLYEDVLYRTAYSYLKNEHDAIEAYQELTYRSLKNIRKVKSPHFIRTWLVRIMINICLDMKKKQGKIALTDKVEISSMENTHLNELSDVIEKLSLEQQELIHLKFFRDLKNSEIARVQNIPEGTVKSRLHKTLRKLRRLIGERSEL